MSRQKFNGISNRGRRLLALQEGDDVDFKSSIEGLHADDLVAFANSERGGALLIGVAERKDGQGLQTAEIVGAEIGDEPKLSILNKASSCYPPIDVEIFFENVGAAPFIRVEIPSSPLKPHCTASGVYKVREDGRNRALHPRAMLALFMELESERFLSQFTKATESLKREIESLKEELRRSRST